MPAADLHRIANAIPELASDDVVRAAMDQVRGPLLAQIRADQRARFARRSGLMYRSISVANIPRGLSARVAPRAFYARLWEGSKRRPFVGPAVDTYTPIAERLIARSIEGVVL